MKVAIDLYRRVRTCAHARISIRTRKKRKKKDGGRDGTGNVAISTDRDVRITHAHPSKSACVIPQCGHEKDGSGVDERQSGREGDRDGKGEARKREMSRGRKEVRRRSVEEMG